MPEVSKGRESNPEEHVPIESFVTTLAFFSDDSNKVGVCWFCRTTKLHATTSSRHFLLHNINKTPAGEKGYEWEHGLQIMTYMEDRGGNLKPASWWKETPDEFGGFFFLDVWVLGLCKVFWL